MPFYFKGWIVSIRFSTIQLSQRLQQEFLLHKLPPSYQRLVRKNNVSSYIEALECFHIFVAELKLYLRSILKVTSGPIPVRCSWPDRYAFSLRIQQKQTTKSKMKSPRAKRPGLKSPGRKVLVQNPGRNILVRKVRELNVLSRG